MRKLLQALILFLAASTSGAVVAQEIRESPKDCTDAPAILATADYLLTEIPAPQPIWHDFEGSDAAYVKIRYSDIPYSEARQLIASLSARQHPPERIQELSLAHATTEERAGMLVSLTSEQKLAPGVWASASLWRALIVVDGGDWLFSELARWREAAPDDLRRVSDQIPQPVADLGDEAIGKLARRAEDAGLWRLALQLYALKSDFADLVAFLERVPAEAFDLTSGTIEEKREQWLGTALYSTYLRYTPFDPAIQPAEVKALFDARPHLILMKPLGPLIGHAPSTAVLMELINFTGEMRIASEVAAGLLADIEAKHLDPIGAPDAVATSMIERLDQVLGKAKREQLMASITGTGVTVGYRKDVANFLDRAVARNALAVFLRGETAAAPARPESLSSAMDWDGWARTARDLLASHPIAEADRLVAADLLVAAGRPAEAVVLLRQSASQKEARALAHDLMHRLDRRCGDIFRRPMPLQEHLYRFDPR